MKYLIFIACLLTGCANYDPYAANYWLMQGAVGAQMMQPPVPSITTTNCFRQGYYLTCQSH